MTVTDFRVTKRTARGNVTVVPMNDRALFWLGVMDYVPVELTESAMDRARRAGFVFLVTDEVTYED